MNTQNIDMLCMGCFSRLQARGGACPICGYAPGLPADSHYRLQPRTVLGGKYLIGKVLGEGGFGITYIGYHLNLDTKIAIKEYYPSGLVTRTTTVSLNVQPISVEYGEHFNKGRERFMEEAKRLARFRMLSGIVMINDFFAENGTAYIVMEYIEGQTLKSHLAEMGGKLPPEQVFEMMAPVFALLSQVHESGIIHRDISPDNIMITREGSVKLLDFGAAREFSEDGNKSLSVLLKHGYAPAEQYQTRGAQGPHTDVYALSATIYKAVTGITPESSMDRVFDDRLLPPGRLGVNLPKHQEAALMKGLAVRIENRYQTASEMLDALRLGEQQGASQPMPNATPQYIWDAASSVELQGQNQQATVGILSEQAIKEAKSPAHKAQPKAFPRKEGVAVRSPKPPASPVKQRPARKYGRPAAVAKKTAKNNRIIAATIAAAFLITAIAIAISISAMQAEQPTDANAFETMSFGGNEWLVLEERDGRALILSGIVTDKRAYDSSGGETSWEHSSLRQYLNGEYYNSFSPEDRDRIAETRNTNSENPWYGTSGGNDTMDKVFLLSLEELVLYFGDSGQLMNRPSGNPQYIDDNYNSDRLARDANGTASWWWLRSPGNDSNNAARVRSYGNLHIDGSAVGDDSGGVRPALWLNLEY